MISIHALREEGDGVTSSPHQLLSISIHALREEGDSEIFPVFVKTVLFLSTPSARRATRCKHWDAASLADFYPRPPRGGRPM